MMDRRQTDRRRAPSPDVTIPDISELLQILCRHRKIMAPIIIIPMIFTFIYLKTKPNVYRATTSVLLENQSLNMSDFQDIMAGMKFDNLTVPTQVEVISSPNLARDTIKSLGVHFNQDKKLDIKKTEEGEEKPEIPYGVLKDFVGNLHVEQQGTSRVIEISFDSYSAENAAAIVNEHTSHYVMSQVQAKKQQAEKLNKWVTSEIVRLKNESIEKSRAVQQFKSENGMVQGLNSEDLIYEQISDIVKQLGPIETKELDLQARVALIDENKSSEITEVIKSELIQSLKSRESVVTQELQSLRAEYGQNHPTLIALSKEISQIKGDIQREIKNIKSAIENELKTVRGQKKLLNDKLTELQKRADSFQEKRITLQSLQLEEAASHKQLDYFLSRSEEINSQIDFTRPDVRVVSYADTPGEPKGSKKAIVLIAVTMLSTLLACCVVFFIEIMHDGLRKKDDVKKVLNLRLLGALPDDPSALARISAKERAPYVEEIKRIYIHLSTRKETNTLLFTSASRNEGKSKTASALAFYLHSIGKKTLLIDANTIAPKMADVVGAPNHAGFYELLARTHSLKDVIQHTQDGPDIITSGEHNPFASDLLVAGHFAEYLEHLKAEYDYIILDTASALEASDADVLARLVDEIVIIAELNKTNKAMLIKVAESMRALSNETPNMILTRVPDELDEAMSWGVLVQDLKDIANFVVKKGKRNHG